MVFSLLTAIAPSVVGGFLSARENRKARDAARVDDATRFVRLREGAEAGGFNPLTALMYGGTGSAMPNTAPLSLAPYAMEGVRAAAAEITGEAAQERAQAALQTRLAELEVERMEAELSAFNARASGGSGGGRSAGALWRDGGTGIGEDPYPIQSPEHTQVRIRGRTLDRNMMTSNAQEIEDAYGEGPAFFHGLESYIQDVEAQAFNTPVFGAGSTARRILDTVSPQDAITVPSERPEGPSGKFWGFIPFNHSARPLPGINMLRR